MKTRQRTRSRKKTSAFALPVMLGELAFSSFETIARRTAMMAQGRCSAAEYQRMVVEKAAAVKLSGLALASGSGKNRIKAALAPFHSRTMANAKRLRKT